LPLYTFNDRKWFLEPKNQKFEKIWASFMTSLHFFYDHLKNIKRPSVSVSLKATRLFDVDLFFSSCASTFLKRLNYLKL